MVVLTGLDKFPEQWEQNCHACPFWREADMMGPGYCIAKYAVHGYDAISNNGKYPCPFRNCRPYKEDLDQI